MKSESPNNKSARFGISLHYILLCFIIKNKCSVKIAPLLRTIFKTWMTFYWICKFHDFLKQSLSILSIKLYSTTSQTLCHLSWKEHAFMQPLTQKYPPVLKLMCLFLHKTLNTMVISNWLCTISSYKIWKKWCGVNI